MRSSLFLALIALAFTACAAPLTAQQPWPVEPGQRVRITSAGRPDVFVVQTVGSGELTLVEVGSDRVLTVPSSSITSLDVGSPRSRPAGFRWGLTFGFIGGALVGSAIGLAGAEDDSLFSAEDQALFAGGVLGVLGGLTGGVIGAVWPGERWQRVAPQTQWTLAPTRSGGIAAVASLRR